METYKTILRCLNYTDGDIRKLIKGADRRGWPVTGRTISLPGSIGDLYGCSFKIDSSIVQPRIEIVRPDVLLFEDIRHDD